MSVDEPRRRRNERKFTDWEDLPDSHRRYRLVVVGRLGWKAIYYKEVDGDETTLRFWQEVYNEAGNLMELHEKYPDDKGHNKLRS